MLAIGKLRFSEGIKINFEAVRSRMKLKPLDLPLVVVVSSVSKKSLFSLELCCAIKASDLVMKPIKAQR